MIRPQFDRPLFYNFYCKMWKSDEWTLVRSNVSHKDYSTWHSYYSKNWRLVKTHLIKS